MDEVHKPKDSESCRCFHGFKEFTTLSAGCKNKTSVRNMWNGFGRVGSLARSTEWTNCNKKMLKRQTAFSRFLMDCSTLRWKQSVHPKRWSTSPPLYWVVRYERLIASVLILLLQISIVYASLVHFFHVRGATLVRPTPAYPEMIHSFWQC
jgi:hypothetical protein